MNDGRKKFVVPGGLGPIVHGVVAAIVFSLCAYHFQYTLTGWAVGAVLFIVYALGVVVSAFLLEPITQACMDAEGTAESVALRVHTASIVLAGISWAMILVILGYLGSGLKRAFELYAVTGHPPIREGIFRLSRLVGEHWELAAILCSAVTIGLCVLPQLTRSPRLRRASMAFASTSFLLMLATFVCILVFVVADFFLMIDDLSGIW